MKDILQDIVAHTHSLGFLNLVKVSNEDGTQNGNGSPIRNHKTIHITDYTELEPSRTAVNRDTIHIARWISQCRKI